MANTIVGVFDSFETARNVRDALVNNGFRQQDVSIMAANVDDRYSSYADRRVQEGEYDSYYNTNGNDRSHAGEGALAGGLIGALGGAIWAIAVPGVGPFTATGWLAAGLIGLAAGAITGGLVGALVDAGVDEEDAHLYGESVRRGYALVTVRADEMDTNRVRNIMRDYDPIDIDRRSEFWQSEGWTGEYSTDSSFYNPGEIERERSGYNQYAERTY